MPVYVIGVSGATCSGKTQMCRKLMASGKYQCRLVSMDDHYWLYNSDKHIRLPEFDNYANYETLASVNWEAFCKAAERAKAELEACGPPEEAKLLLLEGILVLNEASADRLCHGRVFIRLDDRDEFLRRRRERVYEDDPVPDGYDTAVTWPMYAEHCAALAGRTDVTFLNGTESLETLYAQLCGLLDRLLGGDRRCLTSVPV
uniref:Nicotinamide riboside kinase 1 n=1 Tax=Macrostomum lignano TaxID=282301 RepID=A0A1I8GUK4_9PLAT